MTSLLAARLVGTLAGCGSIRHCLHHPFPSVALPCHLHPFISIYTAKVDLDEWGVIKDVLIYQRLRVLGRFLALAP